MAKTKTEVPLVDVQFPVIAVASAGWVFAGFLDDSDPRYTRLTRASVIRVWGTTRGLGELADGGPTKSTKLDPIGSVWIVPTHLLMIIPCRSNWKELQ